jgi:hypothetical protein
MANVFLLLLEGQGDVYVKVVDEETFNWVNSDDLGRRPADEKKSHWEDQLVPASQIVKMKADKEEHYYPLQITIGSPDNDRALAAQPADGYRQYFSVQRAMKEIQYRGDELVGEYYGCIY